MRWIFVINCLFLLMMLTKTEIICTDTETNQTFKAEDSDTSDRIKQLTILVENRMDMLNNDLVKGLETLNLARSENEISKPTNCMEAMSTIRRSGIYEIQLPAIVSTPFKVFCDDETHYGGWTVVMRRFDGSIDFNRNWTDYKSGFGNLRSEFFIGLEKLHAITSYGPKYELFIKLTNFANVSKYAKYNSFVIGSEDDGYSLKELGQYSGDAGDSLKNHLGSKFSTNDVENDTHPDPNENCARTFKGAWWFTKCYESYLFAPYEKEFKKYGIMWITFSLKLVNIKAVEMLIRPIELN